MSGQVRPGYKLTEAGVIPEDWEVKMLKQISPTQSVGLVINPSSYYDDAGTVPMLVGSNVSENVIDWASSRRISELSNAKVGATRVFTGDLVTVRVGEPGVTAVIPPEIDGCNCASMMIVRRHYSFDSTWLCCLMNSKYGRTQVENVQYGTAQKQFNISDAVCFSYPVPPLVEQRAIATALSDMDALISGLDQLIAKKRDIKQAAMQQLLTGQQRLTGFSGEWEIKQLGELSLFLKGKGLPKSELSLSGVDPCIHYGELFTQYPETIGEIISRTNGSRDAFRSIANDVLMPTSDVTPRGLAKASCITIDGVILGGDILIIRSDTKKINGSFLSYVIRHNEDQILQLVSGSTVFHLYGSDMKRFTFSMPPAPEQTAIATILSDMDSELATLETRRDKARQLKQGMMQELLTGRIRLRHCEPE
jgi:type I restriction enzyme S subunit